MAFWKDTMINRLSNLINRNCSAAKISQVLCSSCDRNQRFKRHDFPACWCWVTFNVGLDIFLVRGEDLIIWRVTARSLSSPPQHDGWVVGRSFTVYPLLLLPWVTDCAGHLDVIWSPVWHAFGHRSWLGGNLKRTPNQNSFIGDSTFSNYQEKTDVGVNVSSPYLLLSQEHNKIQGIVLTRFSLM